MMSFTTVPRPEVKNTYEEVDGIYISEALEDVKQVQTRGKGHTNHTKFWFVEDVINDETIIPKDEILVWYNTEFVHVLIENKGHDPKLITLAGDSLFKKAYAKKAGVNYVAIDTLLWTNTQMEKDNMNFDVELMNPPWDQNLFGDKMDKDVIVATGEQIPFSGQYPYPIIIWRALKKLRGNGTLTAVLPTNWMTLIKFKKFRTYIMDNCQINSIRIYNNDDRAIFDVDAGGDVVVIKLTKQSNKKDVNNTQVKFIYNETFYVDLTKYDIWPLYFHKIGYDVYQKVMSKKISDITEITKKPFHKNPDNYKNFISGNILAHLRTKENKPNLDQSSWMKNGVSPTLSDPFLLQFPTDTSTSFHYDWFKDPLFKLILTQTKSIGKNQPYWVARTGLFEFNNSNFNKFFNLTPAEIEYVEQL
jgi:hypothetical protein